MPEGSMRFKVLDSWRGIAALMVALLHFRFLGHFYDLPFIRNGWLWVDFFFVLSGFVITHAYGSRIRDLRELISFVIRRFGRLWPLHAAVLIAFVGLECIKWGVITAGWVSGAVPAFARDDLYSPSALITNTLLVHSLGIHDRLTWNAPSWSISTEFYVCVLFAIALLLPRRVLPILVAAGLLVSAIVVSRSGSFLNVTYDFGFFRCLMGFLTGCLTYRLIPAEGRLGSWATSALEVASVAVVAGFITCFGHGSTSMAAPVVFSTAVWVFAQQRGRLSRFLLATPFQKLGDWSYSIYMIHMLLFTAISRALLVAERMFERSLRIEHTRSGEGSVEVFFFRTNFSWMPAQQVICCS